VHDLLELIEQHMLLVDTAQRATADQLLQKLEKFEEHAKIDKYYIMDPRPINRQAPDKLTIQGALSADAVTFEVNHEYNKARLSAKFSRATQFTQRSMRLRELVIVHPADQSRKIEETYEDLIKVKEGMSRRFTATLTLRLTSFKSPARQWEYLREMYSLKSVMKR